MRQQRERQGTGEVKSQGSTTLKTAAPSLRSRPAPRAASTRPGGSREQTVASPPLAVSATMTIGQLAQAAGVGVETVRYYQRRGLLPPPGASSGAYRRYGPAVAARLRFIKRAQQLGFTLEEIGSLLQLEDGTDRRSIRRITAARLAELRSRMADMQKMAQALEHLLHACEHAGGAPRCPIIESIAGPPTAEGSGTASKASARHGAT